MAADGGTLAGKETRRALAAEGAALAQISLRKWLAQNRDPNAARDDEAARACEARTSGAPRTSGPIAGTRGAMGLCATGLSNENVVAHYFKVDQSYVIY